MRPPKLTPSVRARIVELHKSGMSYRDIADELGDISHITVRVAVKDHEAQHADPPKPPPEQQDPSGAPRPIAPYLPAHASSGARVVAERLDQLRIDMHHYRSQFRSGDLNANHWTALIKQETAMCKELDAMLPAPPPNPDDDPHSKAARRVLSLALRAMVEGIEARQGRLCPACSKREVERGK